MTFARIVPFWRSTIHDELLGRQVMLLVAHGNSLRALCSLLDDLDEDDVVDLNIPTGVPMVYTLNSELRPLQPYAYLGDQDAIRKKAEAVANQGKAQ